jgi:hypothetical protein
MKKGKDIMEALEKGEFDHKNIDIKVLMRAPVILVPENVF